MDNIGDAVKMAGSVLLFILALSLIIPLFTQARQTADAIMDYSDRQAATEGIDEDTQESLERNFYYMSDEITGDINSRPQQVRTVGLNDIIPTVERAFDENFKVVFVKKDGQDDVRKAKPINMYKWVGGNTSDTTTAIDKRPINTIELKNSSVGDGDGSKKGFLKGILYADYSFANNPNIPGSNPKGKFQNRFNVKLGDYGDSSNIYYPNSSSTNLTDYGLVGYLKNHLSSGKIEEYLGVYNKEDLMLMQKMVLVYKLVIFKEYLKA